MGRLNEELWIPTVQWYSRYNVFHLTPIVRKVAAVVYAAPNARCKAVYNKHRSTQLLKISEHPDLYGAYMASIMYKNRK